MASWGPACSECHSNDCPGCDVYPDETEEAVQGRCACGRFLSKYATMPDCMDCFKRRQARMTLDLLRINQGYREVIQGAHAVKAEIEKARAA